MFALSCEVRQILVVEALGQEGQLSNSQLDIQPPNTAKGRIHSQRCQTELLHEARRGRGGLLRFRDL